MLLRLYSEYAAQPEPTLEIVAGATAPRLAATPSFVTVPLSDAELSEEISRPAARVESLPHQATSFAESSIAPLAMATSSSRRATAPASLPSTNVVVPADEAASLETDAASFTATQRPTSLSRTNTLRDMPLRIASRPDLRPKTAASRSVWPSCRQSAAKSDNPNPPDAFAHRRFSAGPGRRPKIARRSTAAWSTSPAFSATMAAGGSTNYAVAANQAASRAACEPMPLRRGSRCWRFSAPATTTSTAGIVSSFKTGFSSYSTFSRQRVLHLSRRWRPEGQITRFYSHGIATLALCEASA